MSVKDASQLDQNLCRQKFSSKINNSAGILEKPKKMAKIADFVRFDPLCILNASFPGLLVCGKMSSIYSSFTCKSMR